MQRSIFPGSLCKALEPSATEVKGEVALLELVAEPSVSHVGCKSYGFSGGGGYTKILGRGSLRE